MGEFAPRHRGLLERRRSGMAAEEPALRLPRTRLEMTRRRRHECDGVKAAVVIAWVGLLPAGAPAAHAGQLPDDVNPESRSRLPPVEREELDPARREAYRRGGREPGRRPRRGGGPAPARVGREPAVRGADGAAN